MSNYDVELIAYAVRKGIERDLNLTVSLTYPPSAESMGQSHGYVSVIALSQRVTIDYTKLVHGNIAKGNTSFGIVDPGKIYIYYRNKITRRDEEPELSSIEIGVFNDRKFVQFEKFHVDSMDVKDIVKRIKDTVKVMVKP